MLIVGFMIKTIIYGSITAKTYAFQYRNWELTKHSLIDFIINFGK